MNQNQIPTLRTRMTVLGCQKLWWHGVWRHFPWCPLHHGIAIFSSVMAPWNYGLLHFYRHATLKLRMAPFLPCWPRNVLALNATTDEIRIGVVSNASFLLWCWVKRRLFSKKVSHIFAQLMSTTSICNKENDIPFRSSPFHFLTASTFTSSTTSTTCWNLYGCRCTTFYVTLLDTVEVPFTKG